MTSSSIPGDVHGEIAERAATSAHLQFERVLDGAALSRRTVERVLEEVADVAGSRSRVATSLDASVDTRGDVLVIATDAATGGYAIVESMLTTWSVASTVTMGNERRTVSRDGFSHEPHVSGPALYTAAEEANIASVACLDASPQPLRGDIVLGASGLAALLHSVVGHASEADIFPSSPLHDRPDIAILCKGLTAYDTAREEDLPVFRAVDDEGHPTSGRTEIISDGRLTYNLLTDSRHSRDLRRRRTGNARRHRFHDPVVPRLHNIVADSTDRDDVDLTRHVDAGLIANRVTAGQVNPYSGEVMIGLEDGYWIEHGELTVPLYRMALVGNWKSLLCSISAVSSSPATRAENCRKARQDVLVGVKSPPALLRRGDER